jgi:hypothetical protein
MLTILNVSNYVVTLLLNNIVRKSLIIVKRHVRVITAISLDT